MRIRQKKFLISVFFSFAIFSCVGQSVEKTALSSNEKKLKLVTLYTELFQNGAFNGNVLVAESGNVIFKESYGIANEATNKKLNPQTIFDLASVSKQFTAMGIVLLKKEGKLSYDDKISKYIPELNFYEGITIKNLLTHTSGLPDYMKLMESKWDKSKIATNQDVINTLQEYKPELLFAPNEKWQYSNTGYLLLATIIERISDKTFADFLNENIFQPLGMNHTFVYRRKYKPRKLENYAEGYFYSDSLQKFISPYKLGNDFYVVFLDGVVGDGSVNSNLHDLFLWDRALYTNELVNDDDRKWIFSSYKTNDDNETDYGFGWMIDSTETYGKIVWHSGGWAGYRTLIERHIDNDKTIIILQNHSTAKTKIPVKNTQRILYGLPVEKPVKLDSKILKSYSGKYVTNKGKEKEIIFENGKLWIPMNPEIKLELIPVSKIKFIVEGFSPEVTYTFILTEDGKVESYRVQQKGQGVDRIAKRVK